MEFPKTKHKYMTCFLTLLFEIESVNIHAPNLDPWSSSKTTIAFQRLHRITILNIAYLGSFPLQYLT